MTRPVLYKRSTAAERRRQRAEFKALKQWCEANPSPETLAARAKSRGDAQRNAAKQKVSGALRGEAISPFSALQLAKVRPAEIELLKAELSNRIGQLSPNERASLRANSWIMYLSFSLDQLRAVASLSGHSCHIL